jgi:hypothetical protein
MSTLTKSSRRQSAPKKPSRVKKRFKLALTAEDIALDNAISAAAARGLAARRP